MCYLTDIGYDWSLGSMYSPLERLIKTGYVISFLTTPERGGRHKRIYELTELGRKALIEMHSVGQAMWSGVTPVALEGAKR